MLTQEELNQVKYAVFNELEDEINATLVSHRGDELSGMDALGYMSDICIRIWSRLEVENDSVKEGTDERS